MPLKYASEFKSITDCPPPAAAARDGSAWRFVFDPVNEDSFIPAALQPSRPAGKATCCSEWGLSMFTSETKATKRFQELVKSVPNIRKRIGTHLAKGNLTSDCGLCTEAGSNGHFDLHPEKGADLPARFSIVGELP